MNDICTLKRGLAEQAHRVAEHLLPTGKSISGEWCVGSLGGEPGKSLKVCTKGTKAGVWSDFATGEGGDLIDLWTQTRGGTLVDALDEIRSYLGVERPQFDNPGRKQYTRPARPQCTAPKSAVVKYLCGNRNISEEVLKSYKIGERGDFMVFPFIRDGELVMVKERKAVDGEKPRPPKGATNMEPCLFGWQAIGDQERRVTICEGEIDSLSLATYGYPAMSVPFGGGAGNKQQWIENEFDNLDRFEDIYLALDNDEEGKKATEEIINRLGRHRCRVVTLPRKDANECLMDCVSPEEIDAAFAEAKTLDPESLTRPTSYSDDVVNSFWPKPGQHVGYQLPYKSIGDRLLFRPGEVTIWTGASGSGKSQLLSDSTTKWVNDGSRLCMASLEMSPTQSLKRMVKQASGTDRPTEPMIREVINWMDGGLFLFDKVGKSGVDVMLEAFEYAKARYGCDQFIIDSLMRLGLETDDYTGQEQVMFNVVDWAIQHQVHVHFVAHSRKQDPKFGSAVPETDDIKGGMEVGANAFNIVSVWRNRKWEEAKKKHEEGQYLGDGDIALLDGPGVVMNICKQRNGDWEGKIGLWFNQDNYQYRSSKDDARMPRQYVKLRD